MKTAVEFLMDEMLSNGYITQENIERSYWLVHKAEEMEKEQKMEDYSVGYSNGQVDSNRTAEKYYNETYKNKNEEV